LDLVERFESNLESYKSGHYNETLVRREFVNRKAFYKGTYRYSGVDVDGQHQTIL
jgi:hypothetical protein